MPLTRDDLVVNDRYWYYKDKSSPNIPLKYLGESGMRLGSRKLRFIRLDTGDILERPSTNSIDYHKNECRNMRTSECECLNRLLRYVDRIPKDIGTCDRSIADNV